MLKEILGNIFAGLGLFFIGVRFIGEHAKQMAGRSFRRLVSQIARHPALSILGGLLAGGLVQSTAAVTFIMTSLVSSRLITVRQAMPVISWSNVGNSLIVLLAVLDLRLVALYLLGLIGVCFYLKLDKSSRFRDLVGAFMGLGLIFLGLILIKTGASPLKEIPWFTRFLSYTKTSYLLAFVIGGFLTFITQSAATVAVVAIAMARLGLLGTEQTIMIIYGSNLGSGASTFFMASNLRGTSRQLAIFQALFKIVGALVLVPAFYAELFTRLPGIHTLALFLTDDFGRQMAYVYLFFQLTAALVLSAAMNPIQRLLEKLSPATTEEELSRAQFISEQALEEPESALDLVEKEQLRQFRHLPQFLDAVREDTSGLPTPGAPVLRKAVTSVGAEVTGFITDLMDQHSSRDSLERALNLQNRAEIIVSVAETLEALVSAAMESSQSESLSILTRRLTEALHVVLTTACETVEDPDDANRQMLLGLTADRGEMMERVRLAFLRGEASLNPGDQQSLMTITTLFERTIWLLRRFGMLLAPRPAK